MPYTEKEKSILAKVGNNIRRHRKDLGISQEELAFQADLDRTYIGLCGTG